MFIVHWECGRLAIPGLVGWLVAWHPGITQSVSQGLFVGWLLNVPARGYSVSQGLFVGWLVGGLTPRQQAECISGFVCFFLACLTSQQQASVSQGRICTDNFTCCHTEIEVADQTFHLTQSQYTDTGPTNPRADPTMPGAWQSSHWNANFKVTGMTRPEKIPSQAGFEPQRGGVSQARICFDSCTCCHAETEAAGQTLPIQPTVNMALRTKLLSTFFRPAHTWRQYTNSFGQKTLKWAPSSGASCRTTADGGLPSSHRPEDLARSSHRTQKNGATRCVTDSTSAFPACH